MHEPQSFGRLLKRLRTEHDLTQDALAEEVGCAGQTIRMYESGARRPSRDLAERMAEVLQVPPAERDAFVRLARAKSDEASVPSALSTPVLTQVVDERAAPAPSLRGKAKALPIAPNLLIGRQAEYADLQATLLDPARRLVTLLGPGGIGKTRLALQVANDLGAHFPGGVAWVSLAPITQPDDILTALATALGVTTQGAESQLTQLVSQLGDEARLVVFDNFEHLLDAVGTVSELLGRVPTVKLLTTSRERLRLAGEWAVELGGLQVPNGALRDDVARTASVLLFVERARQIDSSFVLTPANSMAIARICQSLDGIPLGIELAAAWMRMLAPDEIAEEIMRSLDFLQLADRNAPGRHASLRAVFDHSWRLLTITEREVMTRLAVFRGGFGRPAAKDVAGATVQLLAALVDKSLLVAELSQSDGPRYRLLEPVRQYASDRLAERGEELATQALHAAWYLAWAEQAYLEMRTAAQVAALARVDREHPNLQAAMTWYLAQRDLAAATRLGWALWLFHWVRGHFSEGRRWMEQVLALVGPAPGADRALALLTACVLAYGQGDYGQAEAYVEESLGLYHTLDNPPHLANATAMAGLIAAGNGKEERAVRLMEEGHERYLQVGNKWGAALVLIYEAAIPLSHGDFAAATRLTERALPLARETGDRIGAYTALYNLALVAQSQDDLSEAARLFREALRLSVEMGDEGNSAYCLEGLGRIAAAQGKFDRAAQLWGAAGVLLARGEAAVYAAASDRAQHAQAVAAARAKLDTRRWADAWAAGKALSFEQMMAVAMSDD